jgi:hypothetical protein
MSGDWESILLIASLLFRRAAMTRRNLLVLCSLLVGLASSGCRPEKCGCEKDPFVFEVDGGGPDQAIYDEDGDAVDALEVDLTDCACADQVTVRVTHRSGALLDPPDESECVIDAPKKHAATLEFTLAVGLDCDLEWIGLNDQPPVPFPIKVRP